MLTMFTVPKPFKGHIGMIQRNAVKSWTLLEPKCEVIMLGDEEGIAEASAELGVVHIPTVQRNPYGTPLMRDVFERAEKAAASDVMCFVNADIILMSGFMAAACRLKNEVSNFLMIGRRWNVDINEPQNFGPGWEEKLLAYTRSKGELAGPSAIDYFIFRKGTLAEIPPFAIGRPRIDNWLIYSARDNGFKVVDASQVVDIVHQNHDYRHVPGGKKNTVEGPEAEINMEIYGKNTPCYTIFDANYVLTQNGLRRSFNIDSIKHRARRLVGLS
jgi:hypothetical protein